MSGATAFQRSGEGVEAERGTLAASTLGGPGMRIALVHDFLVHMRGAERFLVLLSEIFPTADLYLLVHDRTILPAALQGRRIYTSFVDRFPFARRTFRIWLPLYPYAVEQFDLDQYDLVISSSMGFAHGVLTQADSCHICCCHTPFRYAWSWYYRYMKEQRGPMAMLSRLLLHRMRMWERHAAAGVDYFIANSLLTQRRIRKYYRREAEVLHYPIDARSFDISADVEDYYLVVSALMPYKRIDIAVQAFNQLGLPLKIIGVGPELARLRASAKPNIQFLGALSDRDVRRAYARCRAFIMTAEEDYGFTPIEAQASGRPVIAYGKGGALETVKEGVTGTWFPQQTAASLIEAVSRFKPECLNPLAIREHGLTFDKSIFRRNFLALVHQRLADFDQTGGASPPSDSARQDPGGFGALGRAGRC